MQDQPHNFRIIFDHLDLSDFGQLDPMRFHWFHSAFLAFLGFRVRKKLRKKEDPDVIGGTMGPIDEATYCLTSRDTLLKMHVSSRAHEAEAACIMMA